MDKEVIQHVYEALRDHEIDPTGEFDKAGRFWLVHADLVSVRAPSRRYPLSHFAAGRTRKYVRAVAEKFNCETEEELRSHV